MSFCVGGHRLGPEDNFCGRCGERPITQCPVGHPYLERYDEVGDEERVDYCTECGIPFLFGPDVL